MPLFLEVSREKELSLTMIVVVGLLFLVSIGPCDRFLVTSRFRGARSLHDSIGVASAAYVVEQDLVVELSVPSVSLPSGWEVGAGTSPASVCLSRLFGRRDADERITMKR